MLSFDDNKDFPFYNQIPKMPKLGWFVLLICIPISYIGYAYFGNFTNEVIGAIVFLIILLIPLLYFSNWDYSLFFQKPTKNEIILAVLMFIAYFIYSLVMTSFLEANGLASVGDVDLKIVEIVSFIFKMMAEELIKFIPLMFILRVLFKYTSNRRLSVIVSSIITLIIFGLFHLAPGETLISVLLIQGLGSAFHLYVYLRTKNLFASYLSHLMTDVIMVTLTMLGLLVS